jgi:hypothetical protein
MILLGPPVVWAKRNPQMNGTGRYQEIDANGERLPNKCQSDR